VLKLARQLWFQVLVGTLAGVLLGWLAPGIGVEMKPLGDGFIALVRMVIAPVKHFLAQIEQPMHRAGSECGRPSASSWIAR